MFIRLKRYTILGHLLTEVATLKLDKIFGLDIVVFLCSERSTLYLKHYYKI